MRDAIKDFLQTLVASWLRPYWQLGLKQKKPSPSAKALGQFIIFGLVAFAAYNLYSCITLGLVYRIVRRGRSGWIAYADDPIFFLLWLGLYSLPFAVGVLIVIGRFVEKKQMRRAALRQFTEEVGPPPIVRRWDDRR